MDAGDGMQATFQRNLAKWHDTCRLEFNSTQFCRAEKIKTPYEDIAEVLNKYTRQSVDQRSQSKDKCFFCDQQYSHYGTLHEAVSVG